MNACSQHSSRLGTDLHSNSLTCRDAERQKPESNSLRISHVIAKGRLGAWPMASASSVIPGLDSMRRTASTEQIAQDVRPCSEIQSHA